MLSGLRNVARFAAEYTGGRTAAPVAAGWISREEAIMGTSVRVELWSPDASAGHAAIGAVMAEMHRIDGKMSPHKPDSELSQINGDAARSAVPVSQEMFDLLSRSIEFSENSGGAFDITFASVGHLFDYRQKIKPTEAELARGREAIGFRNMVLDPAARSVRFLRPGMRIDLGGFAKGYAVDNSAAILRSRGIANAVVTAGGDSYVLGDRRGRPWTIGIRDPRNVGELVAVLPLQDVAMSTSGDYERYFEQDGVRWHHVIDPKTGKSPAGVRSVTVIARDGLTTEALSKCVFVMGTSPGLRHVEAQAGVDAVIVDAAGVLHFSSGLLNRGPQASQ